MHTPRLVKTELYLIKLSSRIENTAYSKFDETRLIFTQVILQKWKQGNWQEDNSVQNWWNLPISNSKSDLHNSYAHTKFGENWLLFT